MLLIIHELSHWSFRWLGSNPIYIRQCRKYFFAILKFPSHFRYYDDIVLPTTILSSSLHNHLHENQPEYHPLFETPFLIFPENWVIETNLSIFLVLIDSTKAVT